MQEEITEILSYEEIMSSLDRCGFVEVPLVSTEIEIMQASRQFLNFLTLPQVAKDSFTKLADLNDRGSHVGYARKSRKTGDSDDKEFFNYRGLTQILLNSVIEYNEQDLRVSDFLKSASVLYESAKLTLAEILKIIDFHHRGIYEKVFLRNPDRFICLRFVRYGEEAGEYIATPHYDRGSCTLAVAESRGGLRVGRSMISLKEVSKKARNGLFFPSYTFPIDTECDLFVPAWHDVIHSESGESAKEARWAIILFADVEGAMISYKDAHTSR